MAGWTEAVGGRGRAGGRTKIGAVARRGTVVLETGDVFLSSDTLTLRWEVLDVLVAELGLKNEPIMAVGDRQMDSVSALRALLRERRILLSAFHLPSVRNF